MYEHISSNKWKTYLLFFLFFALLALVGWAIGYFYGQPIPFIGLAAFIAIIVNIVSYYYSDKIVLKISKARPASKQEHAYLVNVSEGLAIAAGIPVPRMYVIDSTALNAFATGRNPKHSAIAVTTGLMQKLNRIELEGVIAHEMSHIKNYDILISTMAVVMVGTVVMLADFFRYGLYFGRGGSDRDSKGSGLALLIGLLAIIVAPIAAQLLKLAISRKREYLADATGAMLTRYPEGLASALQKISSDKTPLRGANSANASLYIANPFSRVRRASLFSTHPPIDERIRVLRGM